MDTSPGNTNPRVATTCDHCGGKAVAEMIPDSFDDSPASFTLRTTCDAGCQKTYVTMTPQQAREMTKHTYDGKTGRWTKLSH